MRSLRLAAAAVAASLSMAACSNDVTGPANPRTANGSALSKGGKGATIQTTCRSGYMIADGRCVPIPPQ